MVEHQYLLSILSISSTKLKHLNDINADTELLISGIYTYSMNIVCLNFAKVSTSDAVYMYSYKALTSLL